MTAEDRLDREQLTARQAARLAELLSRIHGRNPFYTRKLGAAGAQPDALRLPDDLRRLPFTTKAELIADQAAHPPWGSVLTFPLERYTRYCQTSSTTGSPLRWIDTAESWQWMLECWKAVYRAAGVTAGERAFFPFSFGPFLGFWAGFEAGAQLGLHVVPGGGMSSEQRLAMIDAVGPTMICCTPTYALRLAEVAARHSPAGLARSRVRLVIVAGEPGGSIPATRKRIEQAWGARVIDHHGLTEVGPVSFECLDAPGFLHVNEAEYICEVLEPGGTAAVADGVRGELVLTNLGRIGSPVIRYRTGDLVVRSGEPCPCGRTFARLEGGVLARADDMVNVRGVNVYPAAIEAIVRDFPGVAEFRAVVSHRDALPALTVEIELLSDVVDAAAVIKAIGGRLRQAFGLNVPVVAVAPATLPRFETKSRRFVIEP
ncbi:MAG TPA: AMP-binding protein [Vicinamibacterales bacterium]|jgi:phenylacetate-CoA ligase